MIHSIEELQEAFGYDSITGLFTRDSYPVGKAYDDGYVRLYYGGITYYGHILAWALYYGEWPSGALDHKDRNRSNNAITNLRLATPKQNRVNSKVRKDSKSGIRGVLYDEFSLPNSDERLS